MDNVTDSLLETYLFETNSLLEQLDELLITAEKSGIFSEEDVNEIFRSMHTIKGSSAMLNYQSLMEISHHVEDLFFFIRESGMGALDDAQKSELFNLMFKSTDIIREEIRKVENNEPLSTDIDSFVTEINGLLSRIQKDSDAQDAQTETLPDPAKSNLPNVDAPYLIQIFFDEDCGMEHLRSFMLVNTLLDQGLSFGYYPDDVETNPDTDAVIVESGFFLTCYDPETADAMVLELNSASNIRSYELIENPCSDMADHVTEDVAADVAAKPERVVDNTAAVQQALSGHTKQSLISVNLSKLDTLMAIVGEIVITESMVTASPELQHVKLDTFLKSARQLRKLTDDLQDIAMSLRMVPVSGVFQKMNRIVRDMNQTLHKDVRLTIVGEDTEVDKTIVDSIADPIMHIVRNAMDHGIEDDVQDRIDAGKSPQGEIALSARHTGSEVIISIEDDGRGMDTDAILAKADRNGLLFKPAEEYSQKEILSLLMMPGFSTNTEVTEFSGRGVGLDVVKRNIESIGGIINIASEMGKGSSMTLKIPLTLAIVDGMEISVGGNIFTLPISNIRQSFKATSSEVIYDAAGHEIIRCMEEFYPIVRVRDLFHMSDGYTAIDDGILIWVEASDKSYCLFVDNLLGEQQVVVKPLPSYLNNFNIKHTGISGCTILGDGNISIILDIGNVYTAAQEMF